MQHTFTVTDKYKPKRTLRNWGKPCIWLNNKDPRDETQDQVTKDWLTANCIFIHFEHRLYLPAPIVPPIFAPRPLVPLFLPSPTPPSPAETPLSYLTPSPPPPVPSQPVVGSSWAPITINSQTVYLEDLGPVIF